MYSNCKDKSFILASSSPRRRELFSSVGLTFEVFPADVDESLISGEAAEVCVSRLAAAKAKVIAERFPKAWVLGADTVVVVDGKILGKPVDRDDAIRMVSLIQGRSHLVCGAFTILNGDSAASHTEVHQTTVSIRKLSALEVKAYVGSGESMDKAGSYAVQGIGASLIQEIKGSYTNVVGLPFCECLAALSSLGVIQIREDARS